MDQIQVIDTIMKEIRKCTVLLVLLWIFVSGGG